MNWASAYIWAIYWSITSMVSGGYGDMGCPQNFYEAIFIILFMLCIYVLFAITLNIIWDYISDYREDD